MATAGCSRRIRWQAGRQHPLRLQAAAVQACPPVVVAAHWHAMAGTADETELHASDWIKGREHLLVAFCVNNNIGQ